MTNNELCYYFLHSLCKMSTNLHLKSSFLFPKANRLLKNITSRFFLISALLFFFLSAVMNIMFGNAAVDIQAHDTYFVIATSHVFLALVFFFGMYALLYFLIPALLRKKLNFVLSQIHFWITFFSVIVLLFPLIFNGLNVVPSRYYSFESNTRYLASSFTIIFYILVFTQLVFLFNIFYTLLKGSRIKDDLETID